MNRPGAFASLLLAASAPPIVQLRDLDAEDSGKAAKPEISK